MLWIVKWSHACTLLDDALCSLLVQCSLFEYSVHKWGKGFAKISKLLINSIPKTLNTHVYVKGSKVAYLVFAFSEPCIVIHIYIYIYIYIYICVCVCVWERPTICKLFVTKLFQLNYPLHFFIVALCILICVEFTHQQMHFYYFKKRTWKCTLKYT